MSLRLSSTNCTDWILERNFFSSARLASLSKMSRVDFTLSKHTNIQSNNQNLSAFLF